MLHDDDIDILRMRAATQYHLPAYEAIVSDPAKGLIPITTVIVLSFLGLRWLMKS